MNKDVIKIVTGAVVGVSAFIAGIIFIKRRYFKKHFIELVRDNF